MRRPDRAPRVMAWLADKPESQLYIAAITLGELERGIVRQESRNPVFAADLRFWLTETTTLFSDRILPFDSVAARIWGRLTAERGNTSADMLIAATAIARDAVLATGNVAHFQPTGVRIENPF